VPHHFRADPSAQQEGRPVFNLDIIADEEARTPFEFILSGKTYRVPHVADLTLGQQISLDSKATARVLREVAEVRDGDEWKPAGGEIVHEVLALKGAKVGQFLGAWLAHAGLEPGESGASSS
jgi:hypothetical protein